MKRDHHRRFPSIDRIRGLVMVLMALDHVRDFIGPDVPLMAIDATRTPPALFITRLITHFCAPVFVLLAGISSGLMSVQKSSSAVRRFLFTRGLLLAFLEVTLVRFGWSFEFDYRETYLGVLWAIGISMVLIAPLASLPPRLSLLLGLAGIFLHNLLDQVHADALGRLGPLFALLHEPHPYEVLKGHQVFVLYTLVPWVFVMLLGRGLAPLFALKSEERQRALMRLYLLSLGLFLVVRVFLNAYGDPRPYSTTGSITVSVLDALDCRKYPPSLAYLLITLGPAFFALSLAETGAGRLCSWLERFGQVPLFFYLAHLFIAHGAALLLYFVVHQNRAFDFAAHPELRPRFSLPWVYGLTAAVLVTLTPLCQWFAELKAKRRDLRFLAYL